MVISLLEKTNALRRQHILDAAADVFSEHGFNRASIRDIASVAGVADGTIYNVFENKEALLLALVDALAVMPTEFSASHDLLRTDPSSFLNHLLEERWKAYTPRTMSILRVVISHFRGLSLSLGQSLTTARIALLQLHIWCSRVSLVSVFWHCSMTHLRKCLSPA
jgi:AcrR family transcriptional regulator